MKKFILPFISVAFLIGACKDEKKAETNDVTPVVKENTSSKVDDTVLKWMDIQDAANLANSEKKKYFVDVYTDWCGWCKVMDKKTFSDPQVIKALNERFHVVKFNAEQQKPINFNNRLYEWQAAGRGGVNLLAVEFLGGQLSYPSYVFLDENRTPFKVSKGFMPVEQFLQELATVK